MSAKWVDMSPVSYTNWNKYTFSKAFPHRLTVKTYEFTKQYVPIMKVRLPGADTRFLQSPNILENFLHYSRMSAEFTSLLHPHKINNNTQCTAMIVHLTKEPVWVQIPCDKPLLRDWVCKRDISPDIDAYSIQQGIATRHDITPECESGQFMCDNGECVFDVYVCDGEMDCTKGEDEESCKVCQENGATRSAHYWP